MLTTSNETRRGLFKKLGLFGLTAAALAYYGKQRASNYKKGRHVKETDALVDSEFDEFNNSYYYPGKNDSTDGQYKRVSQYVGAGNSYSSRSTGDRLTQLKFFDRD